MAILYKPTKYDTPVDPESLTEQEHKDACDINKMIKAIMRGQAVLQGASPQYGYDDTNIDGVQFRIQKQKLEEELAQTAETHEFTEEELKAIPEQVKTKFKFKTKKAKKEDTNDKNDQTNNQKPDDKKAVNNAKLNNSTDQRTASGSSNSEAP